MRNDSYKICIILPFLDPDVMRFQSKNKFFYPHSFLGYTTVRSLHNGLYLYYNGSNVKNNFNENAFCGNYF